MKNSFAAILMTSAAVSVHAQGAEVIVFGDSWANRLSGPLRQTIIDEGHPEIAVLNEGVEGARADELSSSDPSIGLPYIEGVLLANPDARIVHLSIGGNDLFDGILFINNQSIVNSLLNRVVGDTEDIVRHMLAVRPDVEVYQSGYDFLRPILFFDPARVNEVMLDLDSRLYALADTIPGYTYEGYYGFAQINYGMPELGIPPFDPSLPDASLPSPASTFVDEIHYTPAVYEVFADDLYVSFYEERLDTACIADVNGDGMLSPADFSAWVSAFNAMAPACDQNGDGACSPADFSAWVSNYNAGC
ncbi:MAG: SGNH/GDSL hydrolase family protein [Phycisphaerales bacterium]|nr:SGNH/GDSL hydrolase family protein [Phycisphaerales bacterium]MCB9835911.1 SGNH/GDSL hydrolase family protein [Phycisphaera sp.]